MPPQQLAVRLAGVGVMLMVASTLWSTMYGLLGTRPLPLLTNEDDQPTAKQLVARIVEAVIGLLGLGLLGAGGSVWWVLVGKTAAAQGS